MSPDPTRFLEDELRPGGQKRPGSKPPIFRLSPNFLDLVRRARLLRGDRADLDHAVADCAQQLMLYPFTILATWFHGMGHGMVAMLRAHNSNAG